MSRKDSVLYRFEHAEEGVRARIREGIEAYRKGTMHLSFADKDGKPVTGVRVTATQTEHEFRHGANLFMLDEFETPEKNARYREKFPEICNLATLPFYWSDLEPVEGKPRFAKDSPRVYRRPAPDLCVEYCREKGIEPKCHCLNYENFTPAWVKHLPPEEVKKKLTRRFRELAERYADIIPSWEVTNETFNGAWQMKELGSSFFWEDDFVEWSFRTADRFFPNNRLIINDWNCWEGSQWGNRSAYFMQIERLLRQTPHLDSIGLQYHSFVPRDKETELTNHRYDPAYLFRVMDLYARFGKKLQITEMTLPAYSAETEDEDVQAELLRNVYTVFFSHPAMEAVIYWNVVDGYAAFAPQGDMTKGENVYHGGLMRFDLSEKPAFHVLRDLFAKEWHTEATVDTADAEASFRGFYGDYLLKVVHDGKESEHHAVLSSRTDNRITITL